MKRLTLSALAMALGFGTTGSALAANGLYVGAGVGQASYDVCGALGTGLTSCDDEDTGWKVFGGYDFNENLAIEAAWVDLGEVSASGAGGTATVEVDGIAVDLKATLPLNEAFGIFGKVGFISWDAEGGGLASGADDDGNDLAYGIGAEYMFSSQFGIRGEWERFDVDDEDADLLSIGAVLKF